MGNMANSLITGSKSFVINIVSGEVTEVKVKADIKDFRRYTGFGGKYIAKLVEILSDISIEGTAEGDEFHIRAL
jgi:hypothetical protein